MLATFFDMILEPVAVKLGYWKWLGNGSIPATNYLCWFLISALLITVFRLLRFSKHNQFAVHLLIIEMLFFAALRTFL
jgi:putative membrane protein